MNYTIKQLAVEAGFYANPDVEKFEKFAELIAAECISVVIKLSPNYPLRYKNNLLIEINHRDQIEEAFRGELVEGIKEHFGVK